ncbi:uncharacterized protein [Lolium perenne]|uniref:uncharacterized protein n=1 Tax=Lolium perenne TaxID=4522 RepID=UPI0021F54C79|nr:uncharacterized protein LOC127307218 [Lolium perenne]
MGSVEERRGAVEIEREHAEQANFGFNLDLGDQALQSFHGPPVEVELEVDERRESRWVNHPMGADPDPGDTIWNAVLEMSTDDDTDDDGEALYRGQVIDEEKETNCPGKNYSIGEAKKMENIWLTNLVRKNAEYSKLRQQIDDLPFPLRVLPAATCLCVRRGYCYHRKYMTHDTSTTAPVLGYREPAEMLQIFSLCLSCSEVSYPISVYGIIAVRDDLEPLRNHLFCRSRDDAVMIEQDSFTLPICTPCRGMYVLEHALLEVDLWVKKEGDGSVDKQLLSAYVEIFVRSDFDFMLKGQISSDSCTLDIDHMFLSESVEAVIEIFAKSGHPHHMRFSAFSSGFDHEIVMFDDKCYMNDKILKHVIAVKSKGKLDVHLKIEESLFCWTFQDEIVGPVTSPDDSISVYGQFSVRVFFAPKDMQPSSYPTYRDWLKVDPMLQ